ncbi:MAG TPA: MFS transporter [Candidatus Dormibacteraeota bacterium]|nr:MFS transporter [Candidatus Dormibacteraeota bacterium]
MSMLGNFRSLTPVQRNTFIACFLGWSLDAFDFFILIFCVSAIAGEFQTKVSAIAEAIFLTLAMRPVGAFLFGLMADRFGRRPTLMLDIIAYSVFELASAFAPSLKVFLIMRACFGVAMGGEWGVGAALAFETLPAKGRGFFSGLLQEGYVVGYLLAALSYGLLFPYIGWRGMFVLGALPAFLIIYIRTKVEESPAWLAGRVTRIPKDSLSKDFHRYLVSFVFLGLLMLAGIRLSSVGRDPRAYIGGCLTLALIVGVAYAYHRIGNDVRKYIGSFLFLVLLMFAFNSFSHGTQDLYPTFLQKNHEFSPATVSKVAIIYNVGALLGGILFGAWSEHIGRRKTIVIAALLTIPVIPLWAFSHTAPLLALGGFAMQFMVQGAWGVIPAHLNELSPPAVRATFPGFAYQLGNLLSSRNSVIQAKLAEQHYGGNFAPVLAWTVLIVAILVAIVTVSGREARGADLSHTRPGRQPA